MSVLSIFAGPNGSGKSSLIRHLQFEGKENLLEADAIAKRINASDPGQATFTAGREVIQRARQYIRGNQSFAVETTLSGNWIFSVIQAASEHAFHSQLVYVCLNDPECCIERVRERVAQGGDPVPAADIKEASSTFPKR